MLGATRTAHGITVVNDYFVGGEIAPRVYLAFLLPPRLSLVNTGSYFRRMAHDGGCFVSCNTVVLLIVGP